VSKIRLTAAVAALALLVTSAEAALAAPTVIKLATVVPEGSVWHQIFKEMGDAWSSGTANRVSMKLYAGGIAGDDPDMLRKMRIGQLQASVISVNGLSELDPTFKTFRLPLFYDSYDEMRSVLESMSPDLEQRLSAKGFVLVGWVEFGWVYLFSAKPLVNVDQVKTTKMFSFAGDDEMNNWWKQQGFQPVAIASNDIPTALQTGMLQALPTTPLAALTVQWYRQIPNMLQLGLGPLIGAVLVNKKTWDEISPEDQAKIRESGAAAQARFQVEVPKQDASSIEEMKKRGLNVVVLDPTQEAGWRKEAEHLIATMRGVVVPADAYDTALKMRAAYRARAGAKR
jgi:TRAP-type C4-dicarboxylate transport system substrate-binding protein